MCNAPRRRTSPALPVPQLYERFRPEGEKPPPALGASRDYNVDLVPKFIMARKGGTGVDGGAGTMMKLNFKFCQTSQTYPFRGGG